MGVKGTTMTGAQKIEKILKTNNGYVTRKDIDKENIHSIYLTRYVKKNNLRQIVRGFYANDNWIVDPYLVLQYKYPRFIYSYNSAVFLLGLGDILPNYLEVTKPLNYHPFSKREEKIVVHSDTVDTSYYLGITEVTTNLGNKVKTYNKEKTICDLIRNKEKIEFEIYAKAINRYARSKDKNINKLMKYARIMKIENKVRFQMEVMLNDD